MAAHSQKSTQTMNVYGRMKNETCNKREGSPRENGGGEKATRVAKDLAEQKKRPDEVLQPIKDSGGKEMTVDGDKFLSMVTDSWEAGSISDKVFNKIKKWLEKSTVDLEGGR